jgi:hypothetical protein
MHLFTFGKVTPMIARRPILNIISRLLSTVPKTMEKHGVVRDVIDTAPDSKLEVRVRIHCISSFLEIFCNKVVSKIQKGSDDGV